MVSLKTPKCLQNLTVAHVWTGDSFIRFTLQEIVHLDARMTYRRNIAVMMKSQIR